MYKRPIIEDIIVPESLLAAASTRSQKAPNYPGHYSGEPASEIHVQKKRQPNPNRQVPEQQSWIDRRSWSHTSAFEPGPSWPLATVIEDPVTNEAPETQPRLFAPRPVSSLRPGLESKAIIGRTPSRASIRSPRSFSWNFAERPRVGSLWDLYDKAKIASGNLHRTTWVQFFFEYGVYVLFVSFVYFILIGVPLWKGSVYWLYWAMKNKFVFQGGWSIAIGFMVM